MRALRSISARLSGKHPPTTSKPGGSPKTDAHGQAPADAAAADAAGSPHAAGAPGEQPAAAFQAERARAGEEEEEERNQVPELRESNLGTAGDLNPSRSASNSASESGPTSPSQSSQERKKRGSVFGRMVTAVSGRRLGTEAEQLAAATAAMSPVVPSGPRKLNVKLPWVKEGKEDVLPPFLRQAADAKKLEKPKAAAATAKGSEPKEAPVKSDSGAKKAITFSAEASSAPRKLNKMRDGTSGGGRQAGSTGEALKEEDRPRAKSASRYKSTSDGLFSQQLSESEQAFMPGDLLKRLGESAGQMPPAPSMFVGYGAVLFVDVSGFTALGEKLRGELVPAKASMRLADTIRKVLCLLAKCCLDGGGEVGKFAGDALLCVWDNKDVDKATRAAQRAAVDMLIALEEHNKMERTTLQIHGGVAKGSILHFHLGSPDDDLRTYLIAGEAVAAATQLVDVALPGEFCVLDQVAKGLPYIDYAAQEPVGKAVAPAAASKPDEAVRAASSDAMDSNEGEGLFTSFRRPTGSSKKSKDAAAATQVAAAVAATASGDAKARPKTLKRGTAELKTSILNKDSKVAAVPASLKSDDAISAVLRDGLPRECNVYIPVSLRGKLEDFEDRAGEIRRRVAILFVELEDLRLTESELEGQKIDDKKLDALNQAFVNMTRITHAFGGEVRDMLFDDKGCIFISCFGAHTWEEIEDNRWTNGAVKTAMAINVEVPRARLGVTVGTCFVGMAGVPERRTDFVVIGHDVNMAARYMAAADPGQIFVGRGVMAATEQIKYGPEVKKLIGKGKVGCVGCLACGWLADSHPKPLAARQRAHGVHPRRGPSAPAQLPGAVQAPDADGQAVCGPQGGTHGHRADGEQDCGREVGRDHHRCAGGSRQDQLGRARAQDGPRARQGRVRACAGHGARCVLRHASMDAGVECGRWRRSSPRAASEQAPRTLRSGTWSRRTRASGPR
jgi:class 3 adenylate cyclase